MRVAAVPFALVLLVSLVPASSATDTVVYANDFDLATGGGWDQGSRELTPSGRGFLGQFGNTEVKLSLAPALPAHDSVTVEFDFYAIASWDGDDCPHGCSGPDQFGYSHDGGADSFVSSFSNIGPAEFPSGLHQSFPDPLGLGVHDADTGAVEVDQLGFGGYGDAVYHFVYTFPHTSSSLVLEFHGAGLQTLGDESWGLDNVRVSVHETGGTASPPVPELTTLVLVVGGVALVVLARRR